LVHDNGRGSGWSLEGKKKHDELYKKSKPIGSKPLQHSTRSYLNVISCKGKRILAGGMDFCVIACWSRIGSEHTNALMSLMT
jgi:hypothetical protein